MTETIGSALNGAVDTAGSYVSEAAAVTGLNTIVICVIAITVAIAAYKVFKTTASVITSLVIVFVIAVLLRTMGLL